MRLVERFTSDSDRLVTALFIAALLHGLVILGIRFASPSAANALPTLEVLLVAEGPEQEANLDASYIAQRNQRGSGTTPDRAQPSLPEPSLGFAADSGDSAGGTAHAGRCRADAGQRFRALGTHRGRRAGAGGQ